jgi:Tfp pilus assembly protein PilF
MVDVDQARTEGDSGRIDGWKRIAAYLERDRSTVKRWEAYRDLPIRRLPGPRAPVYAFRHELEAWLATNRDADSDALVTSPPAAASVEPSKPVRRRGLIATSAAAAIAILAGALWMQWSREGMRTGSPDPETRILYLRGRASYELRTPASLAGALADLHAAVARNPRFAPAYAALADAWLLMPEYTTTPAQKGYAEAEAAAGTALSLDPGNADAHAALGFELYWWKHDLAGARVQFDRALRLAPNSAQTHHWFANILDDAGFGEMAFAEINRASALDPASASIAADRGLILARRDPRAGVQLLRDLVALQPNNRSARQYLTYYALAAGRDEEYLDNARRVAQLMADPVKQAFVARIRADYRRGGRRALLQGLLADARARDDALDQAHLLAMLGSGDEAMAKLRQAVSRYQYQGVGLMADPGFASLRDRPEFTALAARAAKARRPGG